MGAKVRFLYWFAKELHLHTMTQFIFLLFIKYNIWFSWLIFKKYIKFALQRINN